MPGSGGAAASNGGPPRRNAVRQRGNGRNERGRGDAARARRCGRIIPCAQVCLAVVLLTYWWLTAPANSGSGTSPPDALEAVGENTGWTVLESEVRGLHSLADGPERGGPGQRSNPVGVVRRIWSASPNADPPRPATLADRLRRPSSPPAGMKPIADVIRRVPPFGSPKREGQHEQTRRNTGGDARSQIDPPHGGTGARAHRQGRWRDRSPLRLRGYMDGPASLATIPPLASLREARLNGFPGALAVVLRHCIGGSRRRVSDTSAMGLSDACLGGEPAYPPWPHFACPRRELAGGCAPCDPPNANGAS